MSQMDFLLSNKMFLQSMVRELHDQDGSLSSLVPKTRQNRGGVSLLSYLSNTSHCSITSNRIPRCVLSLKHVEECLF